MARFIDHNKRYRRRIEIFKQDKNISENAKELILNFLRDCELGKTLKGSKKKIGPSRCYKIINELAYIHKWFKKDFNDVTQKDMEVFILNLENDILRKKDGTVYAEQSKWEYKCIIRKFYKWYLGNNEVYPDIVSWIDTYFKEKEVPALTKLKFPFVEGDKFHSFSAFTEKLGVRFCLRFD